MICKKFKLGRYVFKYEEEETYLNTHLNRQFEITSYEKVVKPRNIEKKTKNFSNRLIYTIRLVKKISLNKKSLVD